MSLLVAVSWESRGTDAARYDDGGVPWTAVTDGAIVTIGGRNYLRSSGLATFGKAWRTFTAAGDKHATFIIGVPVIVPNLLNTWEFAELLSDANVTKHLTFQVQASTGAVQVVRGDGTVLGSSEANVIKQNVRHFIEVKATLATSDISADGSVSVRVDGSQVITLTNVDNRNGGTANVFDTALVQGKFVAGGLGGSSSVGPLYVCNGAGSVNNDFLGDGRAEYLKPNAAGSATQLNPTGSATNWQNVDEQDPDDADYNGDSVVDDRDLYGFTDLGVTSGTVAGVVVYARAAKSDTGARSGAIVAKSGATETDGADFTLATDHTYYERRMETKPGGGAWSISDVNGAEFGFKVR